MEKQRRVLSYKDLINPNPEYVSCECPELHINDTARCREIDAYHTIEKLRELISNPVTSNYVPRIIQLLSDYLYEIGDNGYPMKHLSAIMKVLEFLAWKSSEVKDYRIYLDRMLWLCSKPPLLERTSESLVSSAIMEHYFTLLGYLLAIVSREEEILRIHDALDCLLIGRARPATNVAAVKLDFRRCSMENSRLPITIVELLRGATLGVYPQVLQVAFTLTSVSHKCCYRMLEAGILNTLLVRMDLPYATQLQCKRPPDIPLEGDQYPMDIMQLIMNLLWNLVKSILPPKTLPDHLKNLPSPVRCAMWGLRYSFKRQILHGQHCAANLRIRNDIVALILAGIVAFPSWDLVDSGIAKDIISLLTVVDSNTVKIWTMDVKFSNSDEDIFFKKTLLIIITHLAHIDTCIFMMKKATIMSVILRIINHRVSNKKMETALVPLDLLEYEIHVLSLLAPRMSVNFVKRKGIFTLLTMIDLMLNGEFDEQFAIISTKTICSIILQGNDLLLENLRQSDMIVSLIKLINRVLSLEKFTMKRQRILTLLLVALEGLLKKQTSVQQTYGEQSVEFIMEIFTKCLYRKIADSQVDQRLLLAIGSYIWKCVTLCPANLQSFLKTDGLYSILDIIEIATYPVRCLYLGMLTDMCDCAFCGPYLCTWRRIDKKKGLMSLFATIWREEEDRIGIKRHADGSITEPELPQMSTKQLIDTYHSKLTADTCPAMIDMIGSTRPKIFSMLKIIERYGERYEMAKEHYKILLNNLPVEDHVTLCCVHMYLRLKLGQVWIEISRYLEQDGITPLSMDTQLISHMVQWHSSWGMFIEKEQKKLISNAKSTEEILEREDFAKIRNSKLAPTLQAFDEIDYIRRTTDRVYMLLRKDEQRRQINAALRFPYDADAEQCHRTLPDKLNVTTILGQHQSIDSACISGSNHTELYPVSPSNSSSE